MNEGCFIHVAVSLGRIGYSRMLFYVCCGKLGRLKEPASECRKKIGRVMTSLYAKHDHAVTAVTEGSVQQIGQTNTMKSFFTINQDVSNQ